MAKKKNYRKDDNLMAKNRKASHDYNILQTYEAGISLKGTEIKSIRAHRVNLKDGFARVDNNGDVYLMNVHISEYTEGNQFNHNPIRDRQLLLHKAQIRRMGRATQKKGITLVPLKVYIKHGFAKVLLGVAQGKHQYDKREAIKRRDQNREISRYMKNR